jgi:hypothetical protein
MLNNINFTKMKKRKLNVKLNLNKERISNLNSIQGGGGTVDETDTLVTCTCVMSCYIECPTDACTVACSEYKTACNSQPCC